MEMCSCAFELFSTNGIKYAYRCSEIKGFFCARQSNTVLLSVASTLEFPVPSPSAITLITDI